MSFDGHAWRAIYIWSLGEYLGFIMVNILAREDFLSYVA